MKTDEFIDTLVEHQRRAPHTMFASMFGLIILATALGGVISIAVLSVTVGFRKDLLEAFASWRFVLKLAIMVLVLGLALVDCMRNSSPLPAGTTARRNLVLMVIMTAAIGAELLSTPPAMWSVNLIGSNAMLCLVAIPALSLVPLLVGMVVMRHGAPASPIAAGVAVGRCAAGIAGLVYALHCTDDSPLFVATWYLFGMMPAIAVGAVSGRFILRW